MASQSIRKPAVAGSFYPKNQVELRKMVTWFIENAEIDDKTCRKDLGFVAPHAGYAYSGRVAGHTYKALSARLKEYKAETFVVVGPNHTGYGTALSISGEDWMTPLGIVKNDLEFSSQLAEYSDLFTMEEEAHAAEHSVEVQLPFIQRVVERPRCVFICMGDQSYKYSEMLGKAIFDVEKKTGRKTAVIASSDFNHYESDEVAKKKDMPAIGALEKLDVKGFVERIDALEDTACGYGPIATAALYAKAKGAKKGRLLRYSNSGETTRDYGSVVSYASIIFE